MRFVISTQEFNYLISKVSGIIPLKPSTPILANILVEAVNDELIVTATDLMLSMRCFTESKVLEEGGTAMPGKKLQQLARELTSLNVELSSNSHDVSEIFANESKFKILGYKKQEFPSLPDLPDCVTIKVSQKELKNALYRTAFAVSREDNRYVFTGVCMQIANQTATFVGTDGKRLARTFIPVETPQDFSGSYTIPLKAVEEMLKILTDEGDATLHLVHDRISLEVPGTQLITKLLSGDYPDVNRVIPETSDIVVSLHREELVTLLKQVSLFVDAATVSARLTFVPGELTLNANTKEIGEGKVVMPANYQGERFEIAFNPIYFLDILRHCTEERITLGLTDPFNPGIIVDGDASPNAADKPNPLFILMPMRLED